MLQLYDTSLVVNQQGMGRGSCTSAAVDVALHELHY